GAIFESWMVTAYYKKQIHRGREPSLFHFRETRGLEIDLVQPDADRTILMEAKPGGPIGGDVFSGVGKMEQLLAETDAPPAEKRISYGGSEALTRHGVKLIPGSQV